MRHHLLACLFVIIFCPTSRAQGELYNNLVLAGEEVIFKAAYQQKLSMGDIAERLSDETCITDIKVSGDTLRAKIYKCIVPQAKYRGEEFGASPEIRSPFDGRVELINTPEGYTVTVQRVSFDAWSVSKTSGSTTRKVVQLTEFVMKPNGKFYRSTYKVKDARALELYLHDIFGLVEQ